MTIAAQASLLISEIPYREDTTEYVERIHNLSGCIFFDSGYPDSERGRYDIFSAAPLYTLSYTQGVLHRSGTQPQPLSGPELTDKINELLRQHLVHAGSSYSSQLAKGSSGPDLPFYGGFAGYFSYDLARYWEKLPEMAYRDIDIPELNIGFYTWTGVVDHHLKKAWLSFLPECPPQLQQKLATLLNSPDFEKNNELKFKIINKLESESNLNSYMTSIGKIQQYIANGDCYQVNFAQRFSGTYLGEPWVAYKKLRSTIATPFGAYYQFKSGKLGEDSAILCYSPERFMKVKCNSVLTQPIKGTIKRHQDPALDKMNAEKLSRSEKDRAENLMIVDLLRNDLGKCCQFGSIKTEKIFEIQSVSNVHHLVSSISGQLRSDTTTFNLLHATLPGGSITGAPKIRAMEIIDELEPFRRSIYCGVMGYVNLNGDMDSNIAIRTILCTGSHGRAEPGKIYCWGGGGIVADSQWELEYEESLVKIDNLLNALASFS